MKVLIVGGACQGKIDYAEKTYGMPVTAGLHLTVRERLERGEDAAVLLEELTAQSRWIVTCDEMGCGVVPMDNLEREWRERVGRLCCALAEQADIVERMVCGIPIRLKG